MTTPQERALLVNIGDRLIDLYTCRAEAANRREWVRVSDLQEEINRAVNQRNSIIVAVKGGARDE